MAMSCAPIILVMASCTSILHAEPSSLGEAQPLQGAAQQMMELIDNPVLKILGLLTSCFAVFTSVRRQDGARAISGVAMSIGLVYGPGLLRIMFSDASEPTHSYDWIVWTNIVNFSSPILILATAVLAILTIGSESSDGPSPRVSQPVEPIPRVEDLPGPIVQPMQSAVELDAPAAAPGAVQPVFVTDETPRNQRKIVL